VLREASQATYAAELAEPIPAALRQRYLLRGTQDRSGWVRVVPELRAKAKFRRLNFMADRYPVGEVDIVFFRNVMIYFNRATQKQVLERMCRLLRPGGYLFVGHTETVSGHDLPLVAESSSVHRRAP
jgi:chemotaxis protein methyltransferase CheR